MGPILLVGWDDVSWSEATPGVCPRLAAFRSEALESTLAFSHPVCSQSRASILFGSFGKKIGTIRDIGNDVVQPWTPSASLPTLPGVLQAAGYATVLVGKWHCGPATSGAHWAMGPIERGYGEWLAGTRLNLDNGYTDWERADASAAGFTVTPNVSQYTTLAQLDAAMAWWAAHADNPNRFMHVALNAPHTPFHVPPLALLAGWPQPGFGASNRQKYLAMLRSADTAFGELLDMAGPNSAVFFYSDNGTTARALAPGGNEEHAKETTFDGGTRVLCLGRWGNCTPGPNADLHHILDIAAGVCAVAGVAPSPAWDSKTTGRSYVLLEALKSDGTTDRACRTTTMKLRQLTDLGGLVTEELYDLVTDPGELSPLDLASPANQSALVYLRGKLAAGAL